MPFLLQAGAGLAALEELRSIGTALVEAGIPVVVLKGMAQGLLFERGGPTRSLADIDLLVAPAHYTSAAAVLGKLGFHAAVSEVHLAEQYEYERAYLKGRVRVEVHRGFASDPRQRVDHAGLLRRAMPAGPDCPAVLRLAPEDVILHHCLHMAEHLYMQGVRPVWELRRLLLGDPPDIATAARRAEAWGLRRTMWCALRLLEECFPGTLGRAVLERFAPPRFAQWVLEQQVIRPAARDLVDRPFIRRVSRVWKWALLIDRPSDLVRYGIWLPCYAWHRFWGARRSGGSRATPPDR
ncbi:MAG: nucleotidyltransferase family protein [Thermoanaerobaculaceae bacterium]|jgi:hypothetical protein|nr:nucleotidyltransferase family protein [Thermoanaerobaculaceae bacterium]